MYRQISLLVGVFAFSAGCGASPGGSGGAFETNGTEGPGGSTSGGSPGATGSDPGTTGGTTAGSGASTGDDSGSTGGVKFDLSAADLPEVCDGNDAFPHTPCEDGSALDHALGLNCPGEAAFELSQAGHPEAAAIKSGFGSTNEWDPREGDSFVVLGTGRPDAVLFTTDCNQSDDVDDANHTCDNGYDLGTSLPSPIDPVNVGAQDCSQDPNLIGTGDCSNTLESQWAVGLAGVQCPGASDYAELRLKATVPANATSISFDVAFFTKEYPTWVAADWNDMFVAWLESSQWTGNIAFDDMGNPLSMKATFFDFKDDAQNLPELAGTCMQGNGATRWLTTTAPVLPGEEIELVLAIYDVGDNAFDSYVFIDNVRFGCEEGPPTTNPAG